MSQFPEELLKEIVNGLFISPEEITDGCGRRIDPPDDVFTHNTSGLGLIFGTYLRPEDVFRIKNYVIGILMRYGFFDTAV